MFRRFISIPYEDGDDHRSLALQRLRLLIDSVCIRRTRDLLELPEGQSRVRTVTFSEEERNQYEQTKQTMIRAIRQRAGEYDQNRNFGMFQAQLQLRILCNHGTFQHRFSWARKRRDLLDEREFTLCSLGRNGETSCSSCGQCMPVLSSKTVSRRFGSTCIHTICSECLKEDMENMSKKADTTAPCPLCSLDEVEDNISDLTSANDDYFFSKGHSSKMTALMADVQHELWESKT